jgi:hypothetical protein
MNNFYKKEPNKEPISFIKKLVKTNHITNLLPKNIKSIKKMENGIYEGDFSELYIIGDIHGDFFTFKKTLEMTECISFDDIILKNIINKDNTIKDGCEYFNLNKIHWNQQKKNIIIVFAGDIIDRCRTAGRNHNYCIDTIMDENCDYNLLELIFELDDIAQIYNSRVLMVLGNHEIMNLLDDFRYVSLKGQKDKNRINNIDNLLKKNLYRLFAIIRINNYIICHGGINPSYFNNIFKNENQELIPAYNKLIRLILSEDLKNKYYYIISNPNSVFWNRELGMENNINKDTYNSIFVKNCLNINKKYFNDLNIIVAHCIQSINTKPTGISNINNKIYRIDVGMSRTFDNYNYDISKLKNYEKYNFEDFLINDTNGLNNIQILKIINKKINILNSNITTFNYYFNNIFKENKNLGYYYLFNDMYKVLTYRETIGLVNENKELKDILNKLKSKIL